MVPTGGADPQRQLLEGLLRGRRGAEPEAEDPGDHRRRRRVPAQRRRSARARTPRKPGLQIVYDKTYPPSDDRLHADRAGDRRGQCRCRVQRLLSAGRGRHGARRQRDRPQGEDVRRRPGRAAVRLDQAAARIPAQRHHHLRFLGAGADPEVSRRRRVLEEIPGQGGQRRGRSARLLPAALRLRQPAGHGGGGRRPPRASTRTSSPTGCTRTRSRPIVGDIKYGPQWRMGRAAGADTAVP